MAEISNSISILQVVALALPATGALYRIIINKIDDNIVDRFNIFTYMVLIVFIFTSVAVFSSLAIYQNANDLAIKITSIFLGLGFGSIGIFIFQAFTWEAKSDLLSIKEKAMKDLEYVKKLKQEHDKPEDLSHDVYEELHEDIYDSEFNPEESEIYQGEITHDEAIVALETYIHEIELDLKRLDIRSYILNIISNLISRPIKTISVFPQILLIVAFVVGIMTISPLTYDIASMGIIEYNTISTIRDLLSYLVYSCILASVLIYIFSNNISNIDSLEM